MAAILPFLETLIDHVPLKKLGPEHDLSVSHTELTKLAWARSLVAKALIGRSFSVEDDNGTIFVRITPGVPADIVPWHKAGGDTLNRFSLFSTNSKMNCPTFDLPSGVYGLGGSCPGARWAQSSVEPAERRLSASSARYAAVEVVGHPLQLSKAVCQHCYASGGKYGEVVVQFSEVARYAFVRAMMDTNPNGLKQLLATTIRHRLHWSREEMTDKTLSRHGIKPIRVHSSGDFFSTEYAQMWMDVARMVQETNPEIRFWAPTRTQVIEGFAKFWAEEGRVPSNFIIRPSAYHIGDHAPIVAGLAKGTSVLTEDQTKAELKRGDGERFSDGKMFNFQCGVYALGKGDKTCVHSIAPDGKKGCRACWMRPDYAVNYVAH